MRADVPICGHCDARPCTCNARRVEADLDQAVKYLRQVFAFASHIYFPEDRHDIARFLARFPDGDCPAHEEGCPSVVSGIPLVGCPACEHKNGGPL